MRYHGTIVYYDHDKGYGFIKPDLTQEGIPKKDLEILKKDLFFHCTDYENDRIIPGTDRDVSFELKNLELKKGSRKKRTYAFRILQDENHRLEKILAIFDRLPKLLRQESAEERENKQVTKYYCEGNHYLLLLQKQKLNFKSFSFEEAVEALYGRMVSEKNGSITIKGYFADLTNIEQEYKNLLSAPNNPKKNKQLIKKSLENLSKNDMCFEFKAKKEEITKSFNVLTIDYLMFDAKQRGNIQNYKPQENK